MDSNARDLIKRGDHLFEKKSGMLSLWQTTAENFYPERADFTTSRTLGDEFASNLTTSYPVLARRDLGSQIGAMLRPTSKDWFAMRASREEREDQPARAWLETMTQRMKRAMYDRAAMFTRAAKEGDHDWAAFGQCAISAELNRARTNLLYRCWHLRDMAWCENAEGRVDNFHRKWKPTALDLVNTFGRAKLDQKVLSCLEPGRDPFQTFDCRHVVLPWDMYEGEYRNKTRIRTPFVSVYLDVGNERLIEEVPVFNPIYVVPRWQTVSGSQYAYSPAVVAALPDARLIQAMTLTLLEAGEKAVDPPMKAVREAIRGDVPIYAGGITWVDQDYDERTGKALEPIGIDTSGIPHGIDMQRDVRAMIAEAFFLNKLSLPPPNKDMTAYEVGQRIQEYIRQAMPLFEPVEDEYNGGLCDITFDILMRAGVFGSKDDIPQSLRGADVTFRFESPLHEAVERQKGAKMMETRDVLAAGAQLDQSVLANVNAQEMVRDVLKGIHAPAKWLNSEEDVAAAVAQMAAKAKGEAMMQAAERVGAAAEPAANASLAYAKAQEIRAA